MSINKASPLSADEPVLKVGAGGMASNLHGLSHLHDLFLGLWQAESGKRAGVAQGHRVTRHRQNLPVSPRMIRLSSFFYIRKYLNFLMSTKRSIPDIKFYTSETIFHSRVAKSLL
jgi:hypothetical protein